MAYSLKSALGRLGKTPLNYTLYEGPKGKELVIDPISTSDLAAVHVKTGATKVAATGKMHWSDDEQILMFRTNVGGTGKKAVMNALCKTGGATKTVYNDAPVEDLNAPPKPPPRTPNPNYNTNDHFVPPMPTPPNLGWLRSVGTPRPPQKVNMNQRFNKQRMTDIKNDTDRGIFKGQGDFKTVIGGVEDLQKAQSTIEAYQQKNPGPLDPKVAAKLIAKYDDLIAKLSKYQSNFSEDGTAKKHGIFSRKKGGSAIRDKKIEFTDDVLAAAVEARLQLQMGTKIDTMTTLGQKAANGTLTGDEQQQYHEVRAEYLLRADPEGVEVATGGTSGVKLMRGPDGNIAYAFKTISGESKQLKKYGLPDGAGTAQEVLTSKLADMLELSCGFQGGFPRTTLAKLPLDPNGAPNDNTGALVEGLPGRPFLDLNEIDDNDLQELWNSQSDTEKASIPARLKTTGLEGKLTGYSEHEIYGQVIRKEQQLEIEAVPPKELQRMLLMNFLSCNADSKWQSVMLNGDKPRTFDGGGAMLSEEVMSKFVMNVSNNKAEVNFGEQMLSTPAGTDHPAKNAPLDQEFIDQITALDVDQVRQEMTTELQKVQNANPTLQNAVSDSNLKPMLQSMTFIKEIVTDATANQKTLTTDEFTAEYNKKMTAYLQSVIDRPKN